MHMSIQGTTDFPSVSGPQGILTEVFSDWELPKDTIRITGPLSHVKIHEKCETHTPAPPSHAPHHSVNTLPSL